MAGGKGGRATGGNGGTGYTGQAGSNATLDGGGGGGGAGGGAGGTGGAGSGNGGAGGTNGNGAGTATLTGNLTGANGVAGAFSGGAFGGGGGAGGFGAILTGNSGATNTATIRGGDGGGGGTARYGGGGGGDGGNGVQITGQNTLTNAATGTIRGGQGANAGGPYASFNGQPGQNGPGGNGGIGVAAAPLSTITNNGAITGGNGGSVGLGGIPFSSGGAGIVGSGLTVINTGSIAGGLAGNNAGTQADAVTFTGGSNILALGASSSFTGAINVQSGSLSFNQSAGTGLPADVTLGASIIGAGGVAKLGAGTLTLTGANTYTGGTSIVAGTLIAAPGSVGSGAITINGGALSNTGNGGAIQNFGNAIVIGASGGAVQGQGLVLQLDGAISGSGAIAFTQGGVRLAGDNSGFTGSTTLQGNVTLGAESGTAFSSSSAFRIASGSTLNTGSFNHTLGSLSDAAGSGGGTVANLSGSAVTLSVGSDGTSTTFSGVIQNGVSALGLTKIGLGTLTLAGANTYTGATTITGGTLQLGAGGSSGSLATASAITIGANGTLAVNHTDLLTVGNAITGSGALQQNGTGGLKLTAANTGFTGPVALNAGTLELGAINSAGTGAITFAAGAQKLQIDVTGTLGNTLTTVGTSDQIDFQALNFAGAFKTYDAATRTLSITNGASTSSVRFDAGSTLTSNQLVLSADADGSAVITVRDALTAAPTGTPGGGPVTVFTGAQNVTVAKADTLVLAVDPGAFTGASEQNGNVVLAIAGKTATITGAQLTSDGIPGVSLAGGDFLVGQGGFSITSTKANSILIGGTGGEINNVVDPGQTVGTHVIFGGVGYADPSDGADTITFGGKGAWGVYGNAGADGIVQGTSIFDSTSFASVFGGKDGDSITLANTGNLNAHFAIYGGENGPASAANGGIDSITVFNTGANASTIIFGGQGAADPTDGADTIIFNGGGSVSIFGNAGDDQITLGATGGLDSTTNAVVHGGIGNDTIGLTFAAGTKATTQVYGDEGGDRITVTNAGGNTVIYGDTAAADPAGGDDTIAFSGQGQTTIYAAGGNDTITLSGRGTATADSTSTTTVFGGGGNDSITITVHTDTIGADTLTLGAGSDIVAARYSTNGAVFGQTITITDFATGSGNDVLQLTTPGTQLQASAVTGDFQTLQRALDAATTNTAGTTTAAGSIGVAAFQGSTYVVVNDGTLGFNASTDLAIKLTGVTDVVGVIGSISILH
nr:autotransporter-associated beta strand repeat-containing protein [Methylobacterium sp. OTU13CASTA1]